MGRPLRRLVRAGLLCGIVDGLWAVVLTLVYGRTVTGLFQGVAATALGPDMVEPIQRPPAGGDDGAVRDRAGIMPTELDRTR